MPLCLDRDMFSCIPPEAARESGEADLLGLYEGLAPIIGHPA